VFLLFSVQFSGTSPSEPVLKFFFNEKKSNLIMILILGRYNKWSRELPQTPWILAGERKLESSVQELISDPLLEFTKAESNENLLFVSSPTPITNGHSHNLF
jgi:tRNA pseudouridine synthase 10